jgi:predicted acetyltransferase
MEPVRVRPAAREDSAEFLRVVMAGFGAHVAEERLNRWRDHEMASVRPLAARTDGPIVGTAVDFPTQLALPGGSELPAAALTMVSVLPTHRRRGVLRALMRAHLEGAAGRGEPLGVLLSSEHPIYGRFGYGPASAHVAVEIEVPGAAFARDVDAGGRLRLVGPDEIAAVAPDLHERARRLGAGDIRRPAPWWRRALDDPPERRGGASGRFHVLHESGDGAPDGYAAYRVKEGWSDAGTPNAELILLELVALSDPVRAALWRFLLDVDLVRRLTAWNLPVDEPLRWLLADPRRMRTTARADGIWVRVVEPGRALGERRYAREGRLALELTDAFLADNAGRWLLEGGPDGASCRRDGREADLALDVRELGAAYLGGTGFRAMARSGLVQERSPGALARADAMFLAEPRPFCATFF